MSFNMENYDEINFSTFDTNESQLKHSCTANEITHSSTMCYNELYPVNNLPEKYRHVFSNFTYFNRIQSKAINTILHSDESIVVSSPTGSEKTAFFELAIVRFLMTHEKCSSSYIGSNIIYVTPIKALCTERYEDWKVKFSIHGLKCAEVTGDTEFSDDENLIASHHIIITTPEKWDSLTRKWKKFKYNVNSVKLFLIDEVHLLNESYRGATLETIVSRMKIISKISNSVDYTLRFVAVSATISNIEDIAEWLGTDPNHPAISFKGDEDERPVKLQKIVIGYDHEQFGYKFDFNLTFKIEPLIRQYSNERPTLIFCSTRKSVEFTCSTLVKTRPPLLCEDKKRHIEEFSKKINSKKIKALLKCGIGCHHAGMSLQERSSVENLFRIGCLSIVVATSISAMGINLPAHLVIIKSTEYYTFNGYKEYTESQILQMIGKAGRPQFDISATAIIMTKKSMKDRYEKILNGNQLVESHLDKNLIEHINTEIFMGTIYDVHTAMDWIRSTFLYVRACKSPQNYAMIKTSNVNNMENRLQNLCLTEIKTLAHNKLIHFSDENNQFCSKPEGEIMTKYSISFETIKSYMQLKGTENLNDIIKILSNSKEFENITLRKSEKGKLNDLNKNKLQCTEVIRFPIEKGINTRGNKINCLLQAVLGTLQIKDSSLLQDANKIILISIRLTKALREITFMGKKFEVTRNACILAKCVLTKLWEQSKFVSKQIPKIGPVSSEILVLNGKTTLQSIRDSNPRDLERLLNRQPPFGNYIQNFIKQIPKYKVHMSFNKFLKLITLKIIFIHHGSISRNIRFNTISILVGDSKNFLLKAQRIRNEEFLEQGGVICMTISLEKTFVYDTPDYEVFICLISDQWVGIDIDIKFMPNNCTEHIKESMSEDRCDYIEELSLKSLPPPQTLKKTSRVTKEMEKEKNQTNILDYLHVISSNDQEPKIVNRLDFEKDKGNIKCTANEGTTVQKIAREKIETQTSSKQNGKITEYSKSDKSTHNKYFYYDELLNDDIFNDLFVPDNNFDAISNEVNLATEKHCFNRNQKQVKHLKNVAQHEVNHPPKTYEPLDVQKFTNKNVQGPLANKYNNKMNNFTKERLENGKILTKGSINFKHSQRTPMAQLNNNVIDQRRAMPETKCLERVTIENHIPTSFASTNRFVTKRERVLSRRIETNLKAVMGKNDFHVRPNAERSKCWENKNDESLGKFFGHAVATEAANADRGKRTAFTGRRPTSPPRPLVVGRSENVSPIESPKTDVGRASLTNFKRFCESPFSRTIGEQRPRDTSMRIPDGVTAPVTAAVEIAQTSAAATTTMSGIDKTPVAATRLDKYFQKKKTAKTLQSLKFRGFITKHTDPTTRSLADVVRNDHCDRSTKNRPDDSPLSPGAKKAKSGNFTRDESHELSNVDVKNSLI